MSRTLTSAQVIQKGEYLDPDFDPASLTISQLLGVFGYHNIEFPSPYTKGRLVQIFNDELKPQGATLRRERLSRQNSQASDDGITDGLTGRPIGEGRKGPTTRMATRRSSRIPTESVEPEPRPEPPKRRRSSAEPRLGGTTTRRRAAKPVESAVAEESEPEEPVRKVSRSKKKAEEAGAEARRVSQAAFVDEGDSGWADDNIFQSGAESSSPVRPVKPRTRRGSANRRKSMSLPPQFAPPPEEKQPRRRGAVKPPESNFEPMLPAELTQPRTRRTTRAMEAAAARGEVVASDTDHEGTEPESQAPESAEEPSGAPERVLRAAVSTVIEEEEPVDQSESTGRPAAEALPSEEELDALSDEIADAEEQNVAAVSQRIAEGGRQVAPRDRAQQVAGAPPLSQTLFRFLLVMLGSYFLATGYQWKVDSAVIGFCDTNSRTNAVLDAFRSHLKLIAECNRENRTTLYPSIEADSSGSDLPSAPGQTAEEGGEESHINREQKCPPLPLVPLPRPDTCTPCPAHATCTPSTVTCDTGFLLRPHPLLLFLSLPKNSTAPNTYVPPAHGSLPTNTIPQMAYDVLASALDGLPGLGPVAFPPRCVENPRRKRHIGALGKAVDSFLAHERGSRVCAGVGRGEKPGTEVQEAKKWGMELQALKEAMRKKPSMNNMTPEMQAAFEDAFNEAIQQLIVWGGVFVAEDTDGKRYLAHHTPSLDLACTVKVKTREAWDEWRGQIMALFAIVTSIVAFRRRRRQFAIESDRVGELVQIALDLLRNTELTYHTDPVSTPHPYLSSVQLRDLILQDEHSVRVRSKLWERVAAVVESNANVRTNLEEVDGGDEMRVWRWVGNTGPGAALPLSPGRTPGRSLPYTPKKDFDITTDTIS